MRFHRLNVRHALSWFAIALAVAAVRARSVRADDFTWTVDASQSPVTTTITAETAIGTYSDTKTTSIAGNFGGTLRLPSYDFRAIHLTTADLGFTTNPTFVLGPGSFIGAVTITTNGIGFGIPGANGLGFAGPGPVAVDASGNFDQTGNGAEGRGILSYTSTGLIASSVGSGTQDLKDSSPFDFDAAGSITQVGSQLRLTVPLSFDQTVQAGSQPVRVQVTGTLHANATTVANGWKVDADGAWTNGANYIASAYPGTDTNEFPVAVFGGVITANRTVTITSGTTVIPYRIVVDTGAAGRSYTFAGPGVIRLGGGAGNAPRVIDVYSGVARFDANVDLRSDTTLNLGADSQAAQVRFAHLSKLGSANRSLNVNGVGTMRLVSMDLGGTLAATGPAIVQETAGISLSVTRIGALTLSGGSYFDVADGGLVVDSGIAPTLSLTTNPVLAAIKQAAAANFANVGVTSSAAATSGGSFGLGYAVRTDTALTTLGGLTLTDTSLLVRYTRFGDADLSKTVDFNDLVRLAQNYNHAGLWAQGDFNYDGAVDFNDLVRLAQNYNLGSLTDSEAATLAAVGGPQFAGDWSLAQSLVPEPAALSVALLAASLVRRGRRAV